MKNTRTFLETVSQIIDSKDAKKFSELITENGIFRFGNSPEIKGRGNIEIAVAEFFRSIKACKHEVVNCWKGENTIVWEGKVTYTRMDDKIVPVNFANIFYMEGNLIDRYLIFIDNTPLFS